jgi:hypothetical protein
MGSARLQKWIMRPMISTKKHIPRVEGPRSVMDLHI